jgi:hypothetical protein
MERILIFGSIDDADALFAFVGGDEEIGLDADVGEGEEEESEPEPGATAVVGEDSGQTHDGSPWHS